MPPEQPADVGPEVVAGLIEPLLDARARSASLRFDEVVAGAAAAGTLSPELARELRYWQRASVHEVTDHIRTVLPAVLPVALSALSAAGETATEATEAAAAAWAESTQETPAVPEHIAESDGTGSTEPPEAVVSGPSPAADAEGSVDPQSPQQRRRLFVAGLTSTA